MYYVKTIEDKIRVAPSYFGSDLEDAILSILREKFERRIFKGFGIVLDVSEPEVLTEGLVIPGDSGAYYKIRFNVLTFIPTVNEVFEAEIKEVVDFGSFASIGPFQGLLHVSQISKDKFFYDKKGKGLISRAEKKSIKKGDSAFVKVSTISLKPTTAETKIGLTMRPDGLGKLEWLEHKEKKKETKKEDKKDEKK